MSTFRFRVRVIPSSVLLLAITSLLFSRTTEASIGSPPAEISEVERVGLMLAVEYFERGPEAWQAKLAEGSLLANLTAEEAIGEIEVRAGSADGALWRLQRSSLRYPENTVIFSLEFPSGLDDTLFLRLTKHQDQWRIADIRCLADPGVMSPSLDFMSLDKASSTDSSSSSSVLHLMLFIGIAGLAAAIARRPWWVAAAVTVAFACNRPIDIETSSGPSFDRPIEMRSLLPLRQVLAGVGSTDQAEVFRAVAKSGPAYEVAKLWEAQYLLFQMKLNASEKMLDNLTASFPLVELLRGRLAFLRSDGDKTLEHYERFFSTSAEHDLLRAEAAEAYLLLALVDEALATWRRLAVSGTRMADVHYLLAQFNTDRDDREMGDAHLRLAWELRPIERSDLFRQSLLASLSAVPEFFDTFHYGDSDEPIVVPDDRSRRAVELPASATSQLLGRLLAIDLGGGTIEVPGGSALAPTTTKGVDAEHYQHSRQGDSLEDLESLIAKSRSGASLTSPSFRRTAMAASKTLFEEKRWDELLALTEGMTTSLEQAPPILVRYRAVALSRIERNREARELLVRLARNEVANQRRDPQTFSHLAELFAADEQYDLAIKSMKKSLSLSPLKIGAARLRQLEMESTLASDYETHTSRHFKVRCPKGTSSRHLDQIIGLLEAERGRLSKWIPVPKPEKIEVHLFDYLDFMETYSNGVEVLGLFDGRVKVPLANVESFDPRIVSILSHELAHAMIAQATHDRAPRWFQEGLAQHVEMGGLVINPLPDLAKTSRILAFSLIEDALAGFSEAKILDLAYSEAAWVMHYISTRYGIAGIHRLLQKFAGGADTNKALQSALGVTAHEFETAAWKWGIEEAPSSWKTTLVRYEYQERGRLVRSASTNSKVSETTAASALSSAAVEMDIPTWHRVYERGARPVKIRLANLLGVLRTGQFDGSQAECKALNAETRSFLSTPGVLDVPVEEARQYLTTAYVSFANAAASCAANDPAAAKQEIARAEAALSHAAQRLAVHGVRP